MGSLLCCLYHIWHSPFVRGQMWACGQTDVGIGAQPSSSVCGQTDVGIGAQTSSSMTLSKLDHLLRILFFTIKLVERFCPARLLWDDMWMRCQQATRDRLSLSLCPLPAPLFPCSFIKHRKGWGWWLAEQILSSESLTICLVCKFPSCATQE